MRDDDVEPFIDLMKAELGVELDRELAAALSISPTAVAGWRGRGRIPAKYRLRFSRIKDETSDNSGDSQPMHRLRKAYEFRLIDDFARRLRDDGRDGWATEFYDMWRAYRLADAHSYFSDMLAGDADKDTLRASYEKLRSEIATDDFINWIENLGT